ncbi:MAG: ABC transporter permease subunit [Chloroflexia bacterium]|nr:ABC transporter permease subunit [Chloroflexia bacterium]
MIASILKHEIKNRFNHWSIFLLYGLLIFQGIWYTKGTFDYYVNEDLLMNAAAVFYKNLAGGGILLIIIVAVLTGPILFKEIQHKTGQWLFTNPIDEKKFFLGRFLAAFSINALVCLGYLVGMLLVPYSGIGEAHRFGDAPFGQFIARLFFPFASQYPFAHIIGVFRFGVF